MKSLPIAEVVFPLPLDKIFHYRIPSSLRASLIPGQRVEVHFGRQKKIGYLVGFQKKSEYPKLKDILAPYHPELVLSEELLTLSRWLADYYLCSQGEALSAIFPVHLRKGKNMLSPLPSFERPVFSSLPLTEHQRQVVEKIKRSIELSEHRVFLLHGVSASGKTEVYFQMIDLCLKKNREVIYLVPEIALTPQFVERIQRRFGNSGLWHSRLSAREKYSYFLAARDGQIKIMLGTRSAIFAPFSNLGLIIIDEEHEFTYKQDKKPFYHAREVVLKRAELKRAVVILGSATPSLESYYLALKGKFTLLELPERVEERELPQIKIADLRKEIKRGNTSVLSRELKEALSECLGRKEQAILFLNRRGYSTFLFCRRCGYVAKCPRCQLSLVHHQAENVLRCHYCRYQEKPPIRCPSCSNPRLYFGGTGTEKVENEIHRLSPNARLHRVDLDTTRRKGAYHKIYHTFKNEEIDILIGTQMIAKGFDFPKVSLVGIVNGDTALHLPDFRAAERTFQLVTQVSGRAGRGEIPGKVVLQTHCPQHYVFLAAAEHNYQEFYRQEITLRRELGYPPCTHLVRILFRGRKLERVRKLAQEIYEEIVSKKKYLRDKKINIIGPAPAAYPCIGGKYRWQILLKGEIEKLKKVFDFLKNNQRRGGVQVSFIVDPLDML